MVQSGEEFYAGARTECSVFGSILAENLGGQVTWTRVLILSSVLDHTCCRASQLIGLAIAERRGKDKATGHPTNV